MSKKGISVFGIVLLLGFPQISETIYSPALPEISRLMETSVFLTELTLSVYFIGFALGVALWGRISDLWGRRPAMLAGILLYTISCFALAMSKSIEMLLFLRGFQALGASAGSVVTQTMIRDSYDGPSRARAFSLVGLSLGFAPAIGPVLGGFLVHFFSWQSNFWFLYILGIFLLGYCALRLEETRSSESQISRASFGSVAKKILWDSKIWGHVLLITGTNGIIFGFYSEGSFLFQDIVGLSSQQYGFFGLIISAATVIASICSMKLSRVSTPLRIQSFGVLLVFIASIAQMIFIACYDVLSLMSFIPSLAVLFLGIGLIIPNSLSVALKDYQSSVGTAGALFGLLYYLGIALCMVLLSYWHNDTAIVYPSYSIFMACLLLVGTVLIIRKEGMKSLLPLRYQESYA